MTSGILGIGVSGLQAFQRGLSVTGHNISNAATEGYSRQRMELATRPPQLAPAGYFGSGVQVSGVHRVFDQFVENQLRTATSASQQFSVLYDYSRRVDSLLANPDSGLAPALQSFFSAVQEVATDPTSTAARQLLVSEGAALADRFQFLDSRLNEQRALVNGQIETTVAEVNSLARALADVNRSIVATVGRGGALPNDLLDQRDMLVRELSERVAVTANEQEDGALNIFVGNGQSLVLGGNAFELVAQPLTEDPSQLSIGFPSGGSTVDVSRFITGGSLGALLEVRSSVLDRAQNNLGLVAQGLAVRFNDQHMQGQDLNGETGRAFFRAPEAQVLGSGTGPLPAVTVPNETIGSLTADDYRLRNEDGEWVLRRVPDGRRIEDPADVGLQITGLDGLNAAESFLIRPTRTAAGGIGMEVRNPAEIAAGAEGSGVGDNTNALALAGLQDSRFLARGTASLESSYGALISEVGTRTRQAEIASQAQGRLLADAWAQRESISGVNLDEEAANLLRYQQAYQAAAQVIAVSNTLFDTLLGAVRR